jgi:hypothetical protein
VSGESSDIARIVALEMVTADLRGDVAKLEVGVNELQKYIKGDIREIRDELRGRPSWAVSIYMTLTTSACVGLLVAYLSNLG